MVSKTFDWKENCEIAYQEYLKDKLKINLMPVEVYYEFEKCNYIVKDLFEDFLVEAEATILHNILGEIEDAKLVNNQHLVKDLRNKKIAVENSEDSHPLVVLLAKKLTVISLFEFSKDTNIQNLFLKD